MNVSSILVDAPLISLEGTESIHSKIIRVDLGFVLPRKLVMLVVILLCKNLYMVPEMRKPTVYLLGVVGFTYFSGHFWSRSSST